MSEQQNPGQRFNSIVAYRANVENIGLGRDLTICDLIDFESKELGNDDVRVAAHKAEKKLRLNFKVIQFSRALWVTRTFEQAMHYAYDSEENQIADIVTVQIPDNTYIITDLADDGVLLLLPEQLT